MLKKKQKKHNELVFHLISLLSLFFFKGSHSPKTCLEFLSNFSCSTRCLCSALQSRSLALLLLLSSGESAAQHRLPRMHSAPFYSQHPRLCELSVPVKMADRPGNSACPLSTQITLGFFLPRDAFTCCNVSPFLQSVCVCFTCGTGQNWSFNWCFCRSKEAALGSLSHVKDFVCHCQFLKLGFSLPVAFWTTCCPFHWREARGAFAVDMTRDISAPSFVCCIQRTHPGVLLC